MIVKGGPSQGRGAHVTAELQPGRVGRGGLLRSPLRSSAHPAAPCRAPAFAVVLANLAETTVSFAWMAAGEGDGQGWQAGHPLWQHPCAAGTGQRLLPLNFAEGGDARNMRSVHGRGWRVPGTAQVTPLASVLLLAPWAGCFCAR